MSEQTNCCPYCGGTSVAYVQYEAAREAGWWRKARPARLRICCDQCNGVFYVAPGTITLRPRSERLA